MVKKFIVAGKQRLLGAMLFLMVPGTLWANAEIPGMGALDPVGEARLTVLFWDVYDARLYAPEGKWSADSSYALSLTYLRDLDGQKIAERSIKEIREQGFADEITLARWYEMLLAILPDVSDQNQIVGYADGDANTLFYLDGQLIGEIREPEFTRAFFDIWLGEKTSQPKLRDQLLGATS